MKKLLMLVASLTVAAGFYVQAQPVSASTSSETTNVVSDDPDESDVTNVTIDQYLDNISGIEEVTGQKLLSLIRSTDSYILFIGFKECPYCREFSKTLNQFKSQSNLPIYYVNLDNTFNDANQSELLEINTFLQEQVNLEYTPTISKITEKKAQATLVGVETTLDQLMALNDK